MEKPPQSFDVCIVCALPEEARAFLEVTQQQCQVVFEKHISSPYKYDYRFAAIKNDKGELLNLHISWLPRYGPQEMTLHLSRVLEECQPRIAIMTGICAGDAQQAQLGDLVVAERTFTYDNGKFILDEQGRSVHLHDTLTYQLDANILQFLGLFDDWKPLVADLQRPPSSPEQLETACHIKAMASGSTVRADHPFEDIRAPVRGTVAIDMEGAAFGLVMSRHPLIRWLVIKGVCDYADKDKNDDYHNYAARASALYALSFIQAYVTEQRMPRGGTSPSSGQPEPLPVPLQHPWQSWLIGIFLGYLHDYQERFLYKHRFLDLKGLGTQGTFGLELASVFVEPHIVLPKLADRMNADPLRQAPEVAPEAQGTIWTFLQAAPRRPYNIVMVGAPGSGKTTILQHLGLSLLPGWRQQERESRHLPYRLPVLLFLRDHAAAIAGNSQFSLADAVQADLFPRQQDSHRKDWIERELDRGQCLVLLDGLDEVVDARKRQSVVEWVKRQTLAYHRNRFIVTSRPHGYRSNPLEHVMLLDLQPFTQEQIQQFLRAWYLQDRIKHVGKDNPGIREEARQAAEELLALLHQKPGLHALTGNPLLLTMLVTVHCNRGKLPGSRAKLYQEICEAFLGERRQAHHIAQALSTDQCQVVLQELAYKMMRQEIQAIRQPLAQRIIQEPLRRVNSTLDPAHFLQEIEQSSGLLLQRESGVYTFAHLTFQEYLAMLYILEQHLEASLVPRVAENWWREVILLYCASRNASAFIKACLQRAETSTDALELAIDCDKAARDVQPELRRRLQTLLQEGVENSDPVRQHMIAGVLLTRRLHQMENLSRDTSLVTCGEYQLFLDEQPARKPAHWKAPRFPSGQGNAPALGVREEQAKAFVTWLTGREQSSWLYRLPKAEELEEQKIADTLPAGTGLWLQEDQRFHWATKAPDLPTDILSEIFKDVFLSDPQLPVQLNRVRQIIQDADRARQKLALCDDVAAGPLRDPHRWARALDGAIAKGKALVSELENALPSSKCPDPSHAHALALAVALAFCPEDSQCEARSLIKKHVSKRIHAHPLSFHLDPHLVQGLTDCQEQQERARLMENMLDICLNLAILEGRIRGRLSALEGILLVKEQKQS